MSVRFHGNSQLFHSTSRNCRFKHTSVIVHNIFAYFALSLSAAQVYMIQERCWFSQINFLIEYFPRRINIVFLSRNFMSSTNTEIRIVLFHGVRMSIPNSELFPDHVFIELSRIAFPTKVLPKGDRTPLKRNNWCLPCWTMILSIVSW